LARAALVLVVGASIGGCGKPVLRVADASLGDYYTDSELKKLDREQRDEYCAELARQDSIYKTQLLETQQELDQSRARSLALRTEGDSLFAVAAELDRRAEREIAGRGGRPAKGRARGGRGKHVVRAGESLWSISAAGSVYGRGTRWPRIYDANRDRVRNPDRIFPGQELLIPR